MWAWGPGAASFVGGVRQTNDPDLPGYVRAVLAGEPAPASQEKLTGPPAMAETVMLALRMTQGIDLQAFEDRFGRDVRKVFPASIERYLAKGWLEVVGGHLRIPVSAMFVSNEILADIVAEAQGSAGVVAAGPGSKPNGHIVFAKPFFCGSAFTEGPWGTGDMTGAHFRVIECSVFPCGTT